MLKTFASLILCVFFAHTTQANFLNQSKDSALSEPTFLPVDDAYKISSSQQNGQLFIDWSIHEGYYLYKHSFKLTQFAQQPKPLDWQMDPGLAKHDEYFGDVEVYYASTTMTSNLASSTQQTLAVTYQGCADAGLCYPPQTRYINLTSGAISGLAPTLESPDKSANNSPSIETASTGLMTAIGLAFLGGLILNLMPCVFPVLSLKALSLANGKPSGHAAHGLVYSAGVITSFIGTAAILLFLREQGMALGWGFQLQSPLFVALLAYLFFIMALNLFGYFEFSGRWIGAGQSLTEGNTLKASFFTGVLAAVVASPCTAPFMGVALGFAMSQPALIALCVFAALGAGLALPFMLIALIPNLAHYLPKPGPWMLQLREFLAFPLFATSIWLIWVLSNQVSSNAAALLLLGGLLISLGLWLSKGRILRRALATVCFIGAIAIPFSDWFQPPAHPDNTASTRFQRSALQERLQRGEKIFVNVTADWCITCLVNERNVLSDPAIATFMRNNDIQYIKADWTSPSDEITHFLQEHGRSGIPLYVVYNGDERGQILPQLLSNSDIIEAFGTKN